jgi:brefeldin A-inhibited guanine nucleotide-exchange protein
MWTVSWAPILPALSIFFEKTEDLEAAKSCLEGFKHAIHLSAMFDMHVQRDTFVNALSKFTGLANLTEMKDKNVEAIQLMISIAQTEGNFLKSTWSVFLNAMSKVDRLINKDNHQNLTNTKNTVRKSPSFKMDRKVSMDIGSIDNIDQYNSAFLSSRVDVILIDKLYQRSTSLENDAIVEFVKCLCEVSSDEIFSQNDSRTYSLHKLIEVAYYNIDRMKLVWGKIWSSVSQHFIDVACKHDNHSMIMGAIDSLRQLSMRFLEQPEDSNFHFQRDFMKPFVHIINESKNPEIRVLIVEICNRMILSRGDNLRSGWKSIFNVFQTAASDKGIVLECAFNNMDVIMKDHFDRIIIAFPDFVKCLSIFGGNPSDSTISIQAIDHMRKCAKYIAIGKVVKNNEKDETFTIEKKHFTPWFAVLTGTSTLVDDPRSQIRLKALTSLFDILDSYSGQFERELWAAIFKGVLYPVFMNIETKPNHTEWIKDTSEKALKLLTGLFSKYFDVLSFQFTNVMQLYGDCIDQYDETLAKIINSCLLNLALDCGTFLTNEQWDEISLLFLQFSVKYSTSLGVSEGQCRNQLLIIETLNELAFGHYDKVQVSHLLSFIKTLDLIGSSSKELYQLKCSNEMKQILLRQRLESTTVSLNILLKMFGDSKRQDEAELLLIEKYSEIFKIYLENMEKKVPVMDYVIVPLMVVALAGIHSFSSSQVREIC